METETMTDSPAGVVIDASRADCIPTGHVLVGKAEGLTDAELASVAGFGSQHWGYAVTRYEDGTATVHLWND